MRRSIIPYNPILKTRARALRANMTVAEKRLWKAIKGGQIASFDFDRQRPIGDYIVDFYCKELHLAIEVDGFTHDLKKNADDRRQKRLEALGVRVLRFWDRDVKEHLTGCLDKLNDWIAMHNVNDPPPGPLEEGGMVVSENLPSLEGIEGWVD